MSRRKQPADTNDYHKAHQFGLPKKIKIPFELMKKWCRVKNHLNSSNADVLWWLFRLYELEISNLPIEPTHPSQQMPSPPLEGIPMDVILSVSEKGHARI
jgi:hypothetical protein